MPGLVGVEEVKTVGGGGAGHGDGYYMNDGNAMTYGHGGGYDQMGYAYNSNMNNKIPTPPPPATPQPPLRTFMPPQAPQRTFTQTQPQAPDLLQRSVTGRKNDVATYDDFKGHVEPIDEDH
ncbi:hypothetical protein HDU67_005924 [Dinochytrium kinnereticum]|nr:hypothetical protein HDU67_005924 [Dinochytrium kinnereticum]